MIILPRQARDKHRENSKKKGRFSSDAGLAILLPAIEACGVRCGKNAFREPFVNLKRSLYQDMLRTNSWKKLRMGRPLCRSVQLYECQEVTDEMSQVRKNALPFCLFPSISFRYEHRLDELSRQARDNETQGAARRFKNGWF